LPSETSYHTKPNTIWFHVFDVPRVAKVVEIESRQVSTRRWGGEEWTVGSCNSTGTKFQLDKMKTFLEMDGGDGCTVV
jgi:hypothetical protein